MDLALNNLQRLVYVYIGLVGWAFGNGTGDWCSIPDRVKLKNQKILLDADLLKIQYYKVGIKSKVE